MPSKTVISTNKAPKAIGPYSAGIQMGNLIYTAGQLGIDPTSGELVSGGVEAETRQAIKNLQSILQSVGADLEDVVKTTVFLQDISDFSRMNSVYAEFFPNKPPARSAVGVVALPKNGSVEIEAIAVISD